MQTHKHVKADSRLSEFCECAYGSPSSLLLLLSTQLTISIIASPLCSDSKSKMNIYQLNAYALST